MQIILLGECVVEDEIEKDKLLDNEAQKGLNKPTKANTMAVQIFSSFYICRMQNSIICSEF